MEHPGVVVMHEANLHHLIADLTIRRGDWDAYMREVELNGGAEAKDYAERYVRTLERGPDYEIPMLKPVLARSRGASSTAPRSKASCALWATADRSRKFRMAPGSSMRTA